MREEEKLARDVYLALSEKYLAAIFINISESEQRHSALPFIFLTGTQNLDR
jgi:hypothetical protein